MSPIPPIKSPHTVTGQERQNLLWMSLGFLLGLLSVAAISAARIHFVGDPVRKYSEHVKQLQDRDQKNQSLQQQVDSKDNAIAILDGRVDRHLVTIDRHQATIDAQVRNIVTLNNEIDTKRNRIQELEVEAIPLRRLQEEEPEMRLRIVGMEAEIGRLRVLQQELEDLRPRVGEMRDQERGLRREVQEKDRQLQATASRNDQLVQRMAYMQQRLAEAGNIGR